MPEDPAWRQTNWKEAYSADIVYATKDQVGFHYLYDNMAPRREDIMHREFNYAIVDEVDSMLLDKSQHMLYLSQHIPGLEHLEPLYVNVWTAVNGPDVQRGTEEEVQTIKSFIKAQLDAGELLVRSVRVHTACERETCRGRYEGPVIDRESDRESRLAQDQFLAFLSRCTHLL